MLDDPSCSGLTSEQVTLFRASGLRRIENGDGVANEDITVHEIPIVEVVMWLKAKARTSVLIDLKVYAGLFSLSLNK